MTTPTQARIQRLEEQLKQLKAREARMAARQRQIAATQAKRDETRRQILAGSVLLERVRTGVLPEAEFREWLDPVLTRAADRRLFGLPVPETDETRAEPGSGQ